MRKYRYRRRTEQNEFLVSRECTNWSKDGTLRKPCSYFYPEVNVMLRPTVSRPVYFGVKPPLRPKTWYLLLSAAGLLMRGALIESESYVTTDGQSASLPWNKAPIWGLRPDFYYCQTLWREDGPVVYNCCWPSLAQSFLGPGSVGLATMFYCLRFKTSFFCCLLRLAGLRWRYSTPPPHGMPSLSKSKLCYDRRSVGQSVLE
jgi:hypothetical protein